MRSGRDSGPSHGRSKPGMRRFDTEKPHRPAFGFDAASRRALVADLAARTRGRARERRDRRRVVVRLHLHQRVRRRRRDSRSGRVAGSAKKRRDGAPLHDGRVVGVRRRPCPAGSPRASCGPCRTATRVLRLAVDHPRRVEDLVAAVLRVRLREHRQLDVGRVAARAGEVGDEVVDLVRRQREAEGGVRLLDGRAAAAEHVDRRSAASARRGGTARRRRRATRATVSVMRSCSSGSDGARSPVAAQVVHRAALDPPHRVEPALPGDVGGLRRPRRDGADPRRHEHAAARAARRRGGP